MEDCDHPFLSCLCLTYNRPKCVDSILACYQAFDWPISRRELIILDDGGLHKPQQGAGWRLVTVAQRFSSLGEKRNFAMSLVADDCWAIVVMDDDDIYLPWTLRAHFFALAQAEWSRPGQVYHAKGDSLHVANTDGLYHASWAFRRDVIIQAGGYPPMNSGEDQVLAAKLMAAGVSVMDPTSAFPPFFILEWETGYPHLSLMENETGWSQMQSLRDDLQNDVNSELRTVTPQWRKDYINMARQVIAQRQTPGISSPTCDDAMRSPPTFPHVRIIGEIGKAGGNGPSNGQYALQMALQQENEAADRQWLHIGGDLRAGEIPWFWSWEHRPQAVACSREGRPFFIGPNVLFLNSQAPRADLLESELLDSPHCLAMFCHSIWYDELIRQHRGPHSDCPIVRIPYPVIPWVSVPQEPADFDLLVYLKQDKFDSLAAQLRQLPLRTVLIRYGEYVREELSEIASRCRMCVYLTDDEQGGLALQEILMTGCPTIGLRSGAPLVVDKLTGRIVAQLDESLVREAMREVDSYPRAQVAKVAAVMFSTRRIAKSFIDTLDRLRRGSLSKYQLKAQPTQPATTSLDMTAWKMFWIERLASRRVMIHCLDSSAAGAEILAKLPFEVSAELYFCESTPSDSLSLFASTPVTNINKPEAMLLAERHFDVVVVVAPTLDLPQLRNRLAKTGRFPGREVVTISQSTKASHTREQVDDMPSASLSQRGGLVGQERLDETRATERFTFESVNVAFWR